MYGYLFGAFCMIFAGIVEVVFGLSAERKSLEDITPPVTALKVDSRDEIQLVPISPHVDK